jgi:hypothetical protein
MDVSIPAQEILFLQAKKNSNGWNTLEHVGTSWAFSAGKNIKFSLPLPPIRRNMTRHHLPKLYDMPSHLAVQDRLF